MFRIKPRGSETIFVERKPVGLWLDVAVGELVRQSARPGTPMITHEAVTISAWLFAAKLHHLLSGGSVPEKTQLLI
jgi:hypothetical protein